VKQEVLSNPQNQGIYDATAVSFEKNPQAKPAYESLPPEGNPGQYIPFHALHTAMKLS
jgi:hypothetical protein